MRTVFNYLFRFGPPPPASPDFPSDSRFPFFDIPRFQKIPILWIFQIFAFSQDFQDFHVFRENPTSPAAGARILYKRNLFLVFARRAFLRNQHFRENRGFWWNPVIFMEICEFYRKSWFPWKWWFCRKWHPRNLNIPIGIPWFLAPVAKRTKSSWKHESQYVVGFFLSEWFTVCTFSRFCADLAPPGPTPESFINATFSWCFWGAFHWKSGNSLKSWILHIFMEFYGFPWNSMKFTKERDSHPSCHFSRRCEGSRNHSIPIGLLMFSRRGREGSALFQEFMIFCIF